jgi:hypothetical protein
MIYRHLFLTGIFSIVFCLLSITESHGQNDFVQGYVVNVFGDTLRGAVKDRKVSGSGTARLKKILFVDQEGKKQKFEHTEISAYQIGDDHYRGFYLANLRSNISGTTHYSIDPFNGAYSFLRLIINDRISLYKYEWHEQGENEPMGFSLIQRGREEMFVRADQGLLGLKTKQLHKYFDECPIVQDKLTKKEFKDPVELVTFYNSSCFDVVLD